jgi:aminopeptidase N
MVTVHEFGHNWWYGMIGNNEFEEAWLDEGINTYSECRMMDHFYGDETSMLKIPGFSLGELASKRIGYIEIPRRDKILRTAWSYIGGGYGIFSYNKPALMLWTLENYIGRPVMDKIMRTFFQKWKFHHPHTQDFIDVVNQVTGKDYNWFFDQILKGSGDLDFRVATVWTGKETTVAGMFNSDSGKVLLPLEKKEKKDKKETAKKDSVEEKTPEIYKSVVKINRKGEVIIPVDVLLVFENGDSLKYKWDGRERWIKYKIYRPSKLAYAVVDPDRKLVLDINFANNSKTIKHQKGPVDYFTARFIMFFETALQIIGFLG